MLFGCTPKTTKVESTPSVAPTLESEATSSANVELVTGPTVDSVTSASIVQKEYIQDIEEVKDEKLEDGVVYEHTQADPIKDEETKDGVKFVEGGF